MVDEQVQAEAEELAALRAENAALRRRLAQLEQQDADDNHQEEEEEEEDQAKQFEPTHANGTDGVVGWVSGAALTAEQIERYSRQLVLPAFGVEAQARLVHGSVLVVGAGGLGSPALLYLAAAGVGRIGICDHDVVEISNLHRQVIHRASSAGLSKVHSASLSCLSLNPSITITPHPHPLTPEVATELVGRYDVVVDATDNAMARYLVNDACAVVGKPLVSGAAIGTEGQLTVYNYTPNNNSDNNSNNNDNNSMRGPCYRCVFPRAPPAGACQRCADAGVLGVVPGIIGTLQALEVIKVLAGVGDVLSRRLLLLDALGGRIQVVKLRGPDPNCDVCGSNPVITRESLPHYPYAAFTAGQPVPSSFSSSTKSTSTSTSPTFSFTPAPPTQRKDLKDEERIGPEEYQTQVMNKGVRHLLLDVRPRHHFAIAALPQARSVPLSELPGRILEVMREAGEDIGGDEEERLPVYVICRRGNDSQLAVQALRKAGLHRAKDIVRGLEGWRSQVDPTFPSY